MNIALPVRSTTMSKPVLNPDGCPSCFPCLAPTDTGCDCECHDAAAYDDPALPDVPNRLTSTEGDFQVEPDRFHLVLREPDGGARLVQSVDDFLEYCVQNSLDPDTFLTDMTAAGRLTDAPASLLADLRDRGMLPLKEVQ